MQIAIQFIYHDIASRYNFPAIYYCDEKCYANKIE